jgi:pimeloyl-ACP methyl ester carboxylesterase
MSSLSTDSTDAIDTTTTGPVGDLAIRARGVRPGAPAAVVLVQGALLSGQTAYDIPVGPPDLALLRVLSELGYAAVTFAIRGYGASAVPDEPLQISTEDAITDLDAVVEWTRAQTGLERVSVLGWSWGGRIAARWAEDNAEVLDRLILMDPALGGTPPMPDRVPTSPWKELTVEEYRTRLEPDFIDPETCEAVARYAAQVDMRAPMGVAREGCMSPTPADPTRIVRPTLMVYGHAAARADYMQGAETRESFFGRLATDERVFAIVPDAGDYMQFQRGRFGLHEHLDHFLAPTLGMAR